jgi:4-hydroxy-2-oxoheptanedioate aldolase
VKQALAAGRVATILSGTNDPDLIDQLGPLDVDGIWLEGEHGGVDWADLGNMGHPEVQQTVDGALRKIVQAGRTAGMLVTAATVERYTRLGVRLVMTSFFPWIQAGVRELHERATAGTRG